MTLSNPTKSNMSMYNIMERKLRRSGFYSGSSFSNFGVPEFTAFGRTVCPVECGVFIAAFSVSSSCEY